jgi:hypothetical protein
MSPLLPLVALLASRPALARLLLYRVLLPMLGGYYFGSLLAAFLK